ncbi:MAG TPA: hypothetical protein VJM46_02570 [Candidatus Saccharimonadales bacterium]|nr:hypothetical protein [Candidatus Saccharimonadales bacterium]
MAKRENLNKPEASSGGQTPLTTIVNPIDALDAHSRLLYEIGLTAQKHVLIDQILAQIHSALSAPSAAMYLTADVKGTKNLISDCKTMLTKSGIRQPLIDAGCTALAAAYAANEERNRMVHDRWAQDPNSAIPQAQFLQLERDKKTFNGYKVSKRDLESIKKTAQNLTRAFIRLHALSMALHDHLPFYASAGMPQIMPDSELIATMKGHFDLLPNGGYRPQT